MDYPDTARGDVAYWGLKPVQAAQYHSRLARMYADRATMFADRATGYARNAERATWVAAAIVLLALLALLAPLGVS